MLIGNLSPSNERFSTNNTMQMKGRLSFEGAELSFEGRLSFESVDKFVDVRFSKY